MLRSVRVSYFSSIQNFFFVLTDAFIVTTIRSLLSSKENREGGGMRSLDALPVSSPPYSIILKHFPNL